ncbi:hypothetical protein ACM55G_03030 [Flavobacterium sp. LB3P122]|uniref:hypothetical protein n=1 Tax=Flavobacterium algoriphilum TaxID=3398738 RepID=UPI003A8A74BB
MAALNYAKRLQNIQNRKFDNELNKSVISKSFSSNEIPENIKYLAESMRKIDEKYNSKTFDAANRVKKHLEDGYDLHFNRIFETQGSAITNTNIKVHSDFDLLTIIDKYNFNGPGVPITSPYTETPPDSDILELREQSIKILKNIYDEVDTTGAKSISIFNKSLNRKVDVVFCFWYHSKEYKEAENKHYKGIYLYDFPNKTKILDYPFAHINNVNYKGDSTKDGSRKGVRLLKNLKADSETKINLSSFHLTSIIHSIENTSLNYTFGSEILIAKAISDEINLIIENPSHRKSIQSPNGTENPFLDDNLISDLKLLKIDLDTLIIDSAKEINSPIIRKALLTY